MDVLVQVRKSLSLFESSFGYLFRHNMKLFTRKIGSQNQIKGIFKTGEWSYDEKIFNLQQIWDVCWRKFCPVSEVKGPPTVREDQLLMETLLKNTKMEEKKPFPFFSRTINKLISIMASEKRCAFSLHWECIHGSNYRHKSMLPFLSLC